MDDGLVLETDYGANYLDAKVLILIVVDNGLVLLSSLLLVVESLRLNPCCSGQWPRTHRWLP